MFDLDQAFASRTCSSLTLNTIMFGISDFPAFCAAVLLFLALPGPGTFALLSSTAKGGIRGGAAAVFGVMVADQVLLWAAVAGVAGLLAANPAIFKVVQYGGAGYLAWLGFKLLLAREGSASPIHIKPHHYARQAFFITLLNPKAIVFYMAFFPLFINPQTHQGALTFAAMSVTIAVITAVYCLGLCATANLLAAKLKSHRGFTRRLERLAGVFLIGFSIRLIRP